MAYFHSPGETLTKMSVQFQQDIPSKKQAVQQYITAVVPNSVELGVDSKEPGSEVEGILPVIAAPLLPSGIYKHCGGVPVQSTFQLSPSRGPSRSDPGTALA